MNWGIELFGRKRNDIGIFTGTDTVSRTGKTRINPSKVASMKRRYNKQSRRLKKAGFKIGGAKPMNRMNPTELAKINKKIKSGNYDVRTLTEPPKWENERPREYVLFRRKSK